MGSASQPVKGSRRAVILVGSHGMVLKISNTDARRIWLSLQSMAAPPTGTLNQAKLTTIIEQLGMVQLDPLRVVARAHDHILWSRNTNYRPVMLERLLAKDRLVFEHFTHDAVVLPMSVWPLWQRQRARKCEAMARGSWGTALPSEADRSAVKARIAQEGPLGSRDFEGTPKGEVWRRSAHRVSLDYLWHAGALATHERRNFSKIFDLTERVIPETVRALPVAEDAEQLDWLCRSALSKLGFGTEREIKAFYDAADLTEVKTKAAQGGWWQSVEVEAADGSWSSALARPDIEDVLNNADAPSARLRIVNPFDPIVRDRARAKRLFDFDYRIEIYTPADKRQYGYYVYPMLEGDRFVGRIEVKADRDAGVLRIEKLWPEKGIKFGSGRIARLESEIERLAKFVETPEIHFAPGYLQ